MSSHEHLDFRTIESMPVMSRVFYSEEAPIVARGLLGKYLVRKLNDKLLMGKIVETEAYLSVGDEAAHTYRGKTRRTEVLFGEPGHCYIYAIHGHYCLNAVADNEGKPGCALIRALEPIYGLEHMLQLRGVSISQNLTNGPGKLCQALNITSVMNGIDLTISTASLTVVDAGEEVSQDLIVKSSRVGISKATDMQLRFYLKDSPFVSRPR